MFPMIISLRSLKKANLFSLMIACALLAVVVVFTVSGAIAWGAAHLINIDIGWLDTVVKWLVGILTGIGGWLMLPALIIVIAGMFQEKTIYRVESVYYPKDMRSEGPRLWPDLVHDIRFTIWAVLLNLLVSPFYLIGIGVFMSIALNAYLLGREFFESVAGYHLGKPDARRLGKKNKAAVYGGGLVITLMTLIPVVNLFVPIIAVVWMVHVYHDLK